jgi:hypothetical protein
MINATNVSLFSDISPEAAAETIKNKALWLAGHPIVLVGLLVVGFILVLLYTVAQNKFDGAFSGAIVAGAVMLILFLAFVFFFIGLKQGHYVWLENFIAGHINFSSNYTSSANLSNITNITGVN